MQNNNAFDVWAKSAQHLLAMTGLALQHQQRTLPMAVKALQLKPMPMTEQASPHVLVRQWNEFAADSWQRSILTLDVLRERGNAFNKMEAEGQPPVLDFAFEPVINGRDLKRPVNYSFVRITPPQGVTIDPKRRPFMIVDPRAGHGAGIGGFKPESQVGEAFEEGHAVYFVTFTQDPVPGQTLADVRAAEIEFLDEIARRHPDSGKPVLIGNCQGGWGCMLLAAEAPDKVGPISINGSPMAYWAGENGHNPMRYLGGLLGGVAPVMLLSDLGKGVFDGSLLVENFEQLNPANTYWKKLYNLYANVDTEASRFLEFEKWWGGFYKMTEAEIRWIVENLFVGNKLAHGQAEMDGKRIDLRNIKSPILVFASKGDNITPPPQALNWIPDLYRDVSEIKARGQRIVYIVHETVGHLGIFVSAKVAGREHDAITDTMRAIEALPPGLYEMVLEQKPDRVHISFAPRTIDDILKMDDGRQDEAMFAAVDQISGLNVEAYETFVRPVMQSIVTDDMAKAYFDSRPLRMERKLFSDENPATARVSDLAKNIRQNRQPVQEGNVFSVMQNQISQQIECNLNIYRDMRDSWIELAFQSTYGSPLLQKVGANNLAARSNQKVTDLKEMADVKHALQNIETGGEVEGTLRILELLSVARGYVRRSRLEKEIQLFAEAEMFKSMKDHELAQKIHQQAIIVQFEPEQAMASLPLLLDKAEERRKALAFVMQVAGPEETMHPAALAKYREIEMLLPLLPTDPASGSAKNARKTSATQADSKDPNASRTAA